MTVKGLSKTYMPDVNAIKWHAVSGKRYVKCDQEPAMLGWSLVAYITMLWVRTFGNRMTGNRSRLGRRQSWRNRSGNIYEVHDNERDTANKRRQIAIIVSLLTVPKEQNLFCNHENKVHLSLCTTSRQLYYAQPLTQVSFSRVICVKVFGLNNNS